MKAKGDYSSFFYSSSNTAQFEIQYLHRYLHSHTIHQRIEDSSSEINGLISLRYSLPGPSLPFIDVMMIFWTIRDHERTKDQIHSRSKTLHSLYLWYMTHKRTRIEHHRSASTEPPATYTNGC